MLTWLSQSEEDTYQLGRKIGEMGTLGDLILLYGGMGSGKTVLSRGIACGAGFSGVVTSPTFTLMNTYKGNYPVYHFDLYRLNQPEELYDLDYEDYFFGDGISIVEWPERLNHLLPSEYLKISIARINGENERKVVIEPKGASYAVWEEVLRSYEGTGD